MVQNVKQMLTFFYKQNISDHRFLLMVQNLFSINAYSLIQNISIVFIREILCISPNLRSLPTYLNANFTKNELLT